MGIEMTPATSQEPSRTATPVGATTPLCSPTSSIPSTPQRGAPAPTTVENTTNEESQNPMENRKKELSEDELKLKTRRETVALGVQLGELERIEFEKHAAAWEEAEKSKYMARMLNLL